MNDSTVKQIKRVSNTFLILGGEFIRRLYLINQNFLRIFIALMSNPHLTVLMPVYNGDKYLAEAVDSILTQTWTDYEFIIINDGSTDETKAILDRHTDPRLVKVTHQRNRGLVQALNHGLSLARGPYIARMDADDISLPERLQQQVQFLEKHPHLGILGTQVMYIDPRGRPLSRSFNPTQTHLLPWHLLFRNCISHPSVMVRRAVYERLGGYDPAYLHIEDYELWLRSMFVTQIANLDQIYVQYRVHPTSVSQVYQTPQADQTALALQKIYTQLLQREDIALETIQTMLSPSRQKLKTGRPSALLLQLYQAYLQSNNFSPQERADLATAVLQKALALATPTWFAPSLLRPLSHVLKAGEGSQKIGPYLGQAISQSGQSWIRLQFWRLYCRTYLRW